MARKATKLNLKKLSEAIQSLPEEKKEIASALLDKAEFMETELKKLQDILKEKGWTETYSNGATQSGLKKSSEAEVYNTLLKNYITIMKTLSDMIPTGTQETDPNEEFFR